MSYIGNTPFTAAFLTDTFSGNGSTVAFTMSVAPANTSSILVAVTGVVQDPSTYSVSGTTLTFSAAPPSGTSNISVRYLGIPASGVTTTAYRTQTEFTATAGQTTFSVPSYTVGYIDVYRNGLLLGSSDFTATTGTTVVLANACTAGDFIETVSFYVSSVLNAIQQYNGLSVNQVLTTPTANTLTSASGSNMQLQTNGGTTALTLDTSGNAGLGVTPSAWASGTKGLEVGQLGNAIYGYSATNLFATQNTYFNGTNWIFASSNRASYYQQNTGIHTWATSTASGTAGGTVTWTQAMTLDASGVLALGITSGYRAPSGYGTQAINGTYGSLIDLYSNGTRTGGVASTSGGTTISSINSAPLVFGTVDTERARIDTSGNFFINRTATGSGNGFSFAPNLNGTNIPLFDIRGNSDSNSHTIIQAYRNSSSTYAFYIQWNGQIYAQVTSISSASDASLKENIRPLETGLSQIMALQPRRFDWIDGRAQNVAGFVAQEVQPVLPDLVDSQKYSENDDGTTEYKLGIRMSDMIPTMVKAIQEQQAIITQLQADVAALKGQA